MSANNHSLAATASRELKHALEETEALLNEVANETGERAAHLRDRISEKLATAKDKLVEIEHRVLDKTKAAAKATDTYVHDHPWQAVGIAAGVGFLLGLLVSRR
jgi:ElaB/YqjD/DUF883 family membrane-anchored ribosome-binding protein